MTVGLSHAQFFLIDHWPGEVTSGPNPSDWTALSATADYKLGTKRMIYDATNKGWATLMFLYYVKGTAALATVRSICAIDTSEMATGGQWNRVCNDGGETELLGPIAIALNTQVEATPYGWWWVGGVCPVDTIATLDDGLFLTDASPTAGNWMVLADSASYCKFHLAAATDVGSCSAFALATDTTA